MSEDRDRRLLLHEWPSTQEPEQGTALLYRTREQIQDACGRITRHHFNSAGVCVNCLRHRSPAAKS